jgi:hypothetical protein
MSRKVKEVEMVIENIYPTDIADFLKKGVKVTVTTDHVSIKGAVARAGENVIILYDEDSDIVYAVNPKTIQFVAAEGRELVKWYRKHAREVA